MDELILRFLAGSVSAEEANALQRWRALSPENEQRFQDLVALWEVTGAAAPPPRRPPVPTAASIIRKAAPPNHQRGRPRLRRRSAGTVAAIAATLVLGLGLGVLYSPGPEPEPVAIELVTGVDETTVAHLPDGTVVRLGPATRLRSVTGSATREASLEGTAFFAVAHDADRPYLVRGAMGEARVLGTRFQMTSRGDEVELTVLEGRVELSAGGDQVLVRTGEATGARGGRGPAPIREADLETSFRWLGGFIAFQSTPLHRAAQELEARFGRTIHFADPAIGEIAVTAWFADGSFEEVLSVICRVADVRCSIRDDTTWVDR